eukprot:352770-Chlamydomonas_euryale.AAC.5
MRPCRHANRRLASSARVCRHADRHLTSSARPCLRSANTTARSKAASCRQSTTRPSWLARTAKPGCAVAMRAGWAPNPKPSFQKTYNPKPSTGWAL